MRWRRLRLLAIFVLGAPVLGIAIFAGFMTILDQISARQAEAIVADLRGDSRQETVLNVAKWVVTNFDQDTYDNTSWYRRYGFLLSHRYMPKPLRLKRGSLALFYFDGECSNMSWVLERLYAELGIEAIQHNLVGPKYGHSALSVNMGGRWAYIDPYMGLAFASDGTLISFGQAQKLVSEGTDLAELVMPLIEKPKTYVYEDLTEYAHGRDGEPVEITIELSADRMPLTLGKLDGGWRDVMNEGAEENLSSHLHYVGPRYSRYFYFRFRAAAGDAPNGLRVVFHVTDPLDPDNLPISNVAARIDGNKLIYETDDPVEGIRLSYQHMRWTLTNLLRRRSWYDVDMVEFTSR